MMDEYQEPRNEPKQTGVKSIKGRFDELNAKKSTLDTRCIDYARVTLPYIYSPSNVKNAELQGPTNSIGSRAVNHLANKLIMTLFQPHAPFFRLQARADALVDIVAKAKDGDQDAVEALDSLDQALADKEREAMQELGYTRYRTEATTAAKSLIITGNSLIYHPPSGAAVQVYSLKDYVVVRDLSGNVLEIITRDTKAMSTFSTEIQDKIRAETTGTKPEDHSDVTLYTKLCLEEDGRYKLSQAANEVMLDADQSYPAEELPWIVLTWNLVRGEDYGRGLVEDYYGAFHALDVLTNSMVDAIAIAADIKFLVNPASVVSVEELNSSDSGSFHSGNEGDVTAIQVNKQNDIALVADAIDKYERQIAQAFLIGTAVTRDAERVTAEEIRYNANELEMSHGGIYSRFAEEWQLKTALLLLKRIGMEVGKDQVINPEIITGLDSLSRAGDMDNLRMFINDMNMLQALPEAMLAAINMTRFAAYVGIRRGVDYTKFIKTPAEQQAEQQAALAAQNQQMDAQAGADMAVEAGKQSIKEE